MEWQNKINQPKNQNQSLQSFILKLSSVLFLPTRIFQTQTGIANLGGDLPFVLYKNGYMNMKAKFKYKKLLKSDDWHPRVFNSCFGIATLLRHVIAGNNLNFGLSASTLDAKEHKMYYQSTIYHKTVVVSCLQLKIPLLCTCNFAHFIDLKEVFKGKHEGMLHILVFRIFSAC